MELFNIFIDKLRIIFMDTMDYFELSPLDLILAIYFCFIFFFFFIIFYFYFFGNIKTWIRFMKL